MSEPENVTERSANAVLFWDIDGTLLTTGRAGVFALEDALRELHGADSSLQEVITATGLTDAGIAEISLGAVGTDSSAEAVDSFLRAYERSLPAALHRRRGRVLPNVLGVLGALATRDDVLSLLLTGNTRNGAGAKLAHYGLERFFPNGGSFCVEQKPREEIARRARSLARSQKDCFRRCRPACS